MKKTAIKMMALALVIISCAKKKTNEPEPAVTDSQVPTITYLLNFNSMYSPSTKVKINFKTTDNYRLKNILLRVKNTSIDSVYLNRSILTSVKELTVLDSVVTNLTTSMADFEVFVQVEDSAGNKAVSTRNFHVM